MYILVSLGDNADKAQINWGIYNILFKLKINWNNNDFKLDFNHNMRPQDYVIMHVSHKHHTLIHTDTDSFI